MKLWMALASVAASTVVAATGAPGTATADTPASVRVLMLASDHQWWSEPLSGGTPTPLGLYGVPGEQFSPDGTLLAYVAPGYVIPTQPSQPILYIYPVASSAPASPVRTAFTNIGLRGWTPDGRVLEAYGAGAERYLYAAVPTQGGASTRLGKLQADGFTYSPDQRLAARTNPALGKVEVWDVRTSTPAGSFTVPQTKVTSSESAGRFGYSTVSWSPTGTRLAVVTTVSERSDPYTYESGKVVLYDLRTHQTNTYDGHHLHGAFSPDGATYCWSDRDQDTATTLGPDGPVRSELVRCVGSALDVITDLTVPSPGGITALQVVAGPMAPPLDVDHGSIGKTTGKALPSQLRGKLPLVGNDGAGAALVLRKGSAAAKNPVDGRSLGLSVDGTFRIDELPPSTTYSVTAFPRAWDGSLGPSRSITLRTPKTPGTETKLTFARDNNPHSANAHALFVHVQVVRADTGRPVVGAHVDLLGAVFSRRDDTDGQLGPFHRFASVVTNAKGRASVTIQADRFNGFVARTAATGNLAASTDGPRYA